MAKQTASWIAARCSKASPGPGQGRSMAYRAFSRQRLLKRSRQRAVKDVHVQDDRDRARWRREHAAEHSRELLVREQPRRGRAQPEADEEAVRWLLEPSPPGPPRWPAGSQMGRHAEELPQGVAPSPPPGPGGGGGAEIPTVLLASRQAGSSSGPAGRRHARCGGHSGQLSRLKDVRPIRPRGGVPQRLRDEGTRHACVGERRRRRPPHAVRPETRGDPAGCAEGPGGEHPAEGARRQDSCWL